MLFVCVLLFFRLIVIAGLSFYNNGFRSSHSSSAEHKFGGMGVTVMPALSDNYMYLVRNSIVSIKVTNFFTSNDEAKNSGGS